ncbi:MAG: CHASE2 domain-containing protein [Woeseiaceae bacterium]|nr:CHASE2 domain-containing protein [Woeseiaceae bacterium]
MKSQQKQKRNRIITLAFVSVLMLLVYGPLAQWFVAADRMLYDRLASQLPNKPLENAFIVSIEAKNADADEISATYGRIIEVLSVAGARRIIMTEPPEIPDDRNLPGWAAAMNSIVPVYVPTRHRLAELATRHGFIDVKADSDGILRESGLWQLNDGVMSPSLPLAVAFDNEEASSHHRMSSAVNSIFLSN